MNSENENQPEKSPQDQDTFTPADDSSEAKNSSETPAPRYQKYGKPRPFRGNRGGKNYDARAENSSDSDAASPDEGQQRNRPRERSQDQRRQQPRQQGQPRTQRPEQTSGLDISVVVPVYNENDSLRELASRIKSALSRVSQRWEVWFIDDGSTDGSFETLDNLYRNDRRFKVIRFRRNFGKSAALSIGFQHARGQYVITMDGDLQDDPEEIPRLIEKIKSGFDLVSGWKKKRKDPINKTIPSKFFNYVTGKISGIKIHDFNCGLKGYKREVVKAVPLYGEMHRYIPVLAKMLGFSVSEIPVTHHPRKFGRTKFGMSRFFKGFLDLLTVIFTSRYTQRPLHLFGTIGIFFFLVGVGINGYLSVEWWMGYPIGNRPMLWLGILLILVGIQSISTGLLAEMITKSQQGSVQYSVRQILR